LFIFVMLLLSSTYVIKTNQFAVIKQFGKIMEIKSEPGLYLKVPVIQNVQKVDKMKRLYDVAKSDVITKDKKSLISDSYVVYRVKDAKKYVVWYRKGGKCIPCRSILSSSTRNYG